jgi:hypothetical protein
MTGRERKRVERCTREILGLCDHELPPASREHRAQPLLQRCRHSRRLVAFGALWAIAAAALVSLVACSMRLP